MFKKILIANRGEIAVRIIRSCEELGIASVGLYTPADQGSLHLRLASECAPLASSASLREAATLIEIARQKGADAIHPGYGFLAEESEFILQCQAAGLVFIGPPVEVVQAARHKIKALNTAQAAGFKTVTYSPGHFGREDGPALAAAAQALGYPLVIKSCRGGRGRGAQMVNSSEGLPATLHRAQGESQAVYGDSRVYLEKAILPVHMVSVQILGDRCGARVHLGERECSLRSGNQKLVEEMPAPCLNAGQRSELLEIALKLAGLFEIQNAASLEFLIDSEGQIYFSEIKARIQMEHLLTELTTRIDLVKAQIRLAAGEALGLQQTDVHIQGCAVSCRVSALDPARQFLPSPGRVRRLQLPAGPEIRTDTYLTPGCEIPIDFDPLIAKVAAWGEDRPASLSRMRRALGEFELDGVDTNLPVLRNVFAQPNLAHCPCDEPEPERIPLGAPQAEGQLRDLAAVAGLLYVMRSKTPQPSIPARLQTGWHRYSRRLPE